MKNWSNIDSELSNLRQQYMESSEEQRVSTAAIGAPAIGQLSGKLPGKNVEIWIVDADRESSQQLSLLIEQDGMQTRCFGDQQSTIDAFTKGLPAAFIINFRLPDGQGYQLINQIRNQSQGDSPAIVMLSAHSEFLDKVEAIRCGADCYFEKPIDAENLKRRLKHLLEKHGNTQRVLYLEADPDQALLVSINLESAGFAVDVCSDPRELGSALAAQHPDLLLIDPAISNNGYDLIRYLRHDERYAALPIVVLTEQIDEIARFNTIKAGGDDHLRKPVEAWLLIATVMARIERASMIKSMVEHDALTRLLTAAAFLERAEAIVTQNSNNGTRHTALVIIDLDEFKLINERYGYAIGDRLLATISAMLRRRLRRSDIISRYGSDKFAVIVEDLESEETIELASQLLAEIAALDYTLADGTICRVSASAGIAMLDQAMDLARWRGAAENALLTAKQIGPNSISTGTESTRVEASLQLNLVAIGGGTGLSSLLSGFKTYVKDGRRYQRYRGIALQNLTAIVTVTDDGGSSGRLREEFHILPPGDIRNCMVALSEDEKLLTQLFQYRFPGEGNLNGHSFGNLFLTGLTGVTGDFLKAIQLSSDVLAIRGRIYPSTTTDVVLIAELDSGEVVRGETKVAKYGPRIKRISLSPEHCHPLDETLTAIAQADIITLGPGSLFTSVIPNLLVAGIADAIAQSPAIKIYIVNIMTQPGETDGLGVREHLNILLESAPQLKLDYVVINSREISADMRERYLAEGAEQIGLPEAECEFIEANGSMIQVIARDLLDEGDKVRHSTIKLAQAVFDACQNCREE